MVAVMAGAVSFAVIPVMVLGIGFEARIESWLRQDLSFLQRFWLLAGVLATDILLPVPSSAISTYGGGIIGTLPATLASWLGMSVGACLGFAAARWIGQPVLLWFVGPQDFESLQEPVREHGVTTLILTRALPILAEAAVLMVGAIGLSWRKFLPPVLLCNLIISLVYAACGEYFADRNALPWAVVVSGTIPLLAALLTRRILSRRSAAANRSEHSITNGTAPRE